MPKLPGLAKLTVLITLLPLIPRVLKITLGEPYNVRDPFDWAFMISAGFAGVSIVSVAAWFTLKSHQPSEVAPPAPTKPFNQRAFGMMILPVALIEFSVITGTLSATDGNDPFVISPLSWISYALWGVALVALAGIGIWSAFIERRGRDFLT
ncbi:hypothetical protein ACTWPT_33375 [Nonomuraea sp. 3N208]|uniref:hypothetical protein n=1 Tax=Nonomuraea sp. 3N208 TaxID=3457421 RepID=UPI003FD56138